MGGEVTTVVGDVGMRSESVDVNGKGNSSPLPPRRYYAIRVGSSIEVRSTRKPIKKIVSTIKRVSPEGHPYTLSQVYYDGGVVLSTWTWVVYAGVAQKYGQDYPKEDGYTHITHPSLIKEAVSGPRK